MDSSRRLWVKRFVLGTAASMTLPEWSGLLLADVETLPGEAVLKLKGTDYPNLEGVGGSIQLLFNNLSKPFTLNRISPQEFVTLDSICTHRGCTVGPFILAENCMRCPCHGSRYDLEGRVFRDGLGSTEPAPDDLHRFETTYDETTDLISITIPGLALAISSIKAYPQLQTGVVKVQLRFPVTGGSTYEISHQTTLDGGLEVVPFSTTPDGNELVTSVTPGASGFMTAYLDVNGVRGFYVVGLKMSPV